RAAGPRDARRVERRLAGSEVADLVVGDGGEGQNLEVRAAAAGETGHAECRGREREELAAVEPGRFGGVVLQLGLAERLVDVGEAGKLFARERLELRRVGELLQAAVVALRVRVHRWHPWQFIGGFTCRSFLIAEPMSVAVCPPPGVQVRF